ncbi:MAG: hypothetical protein AB7V50_09255 [Vampirovibrionia bacterium]
MANISPVSFKGMPPATGTHTVPRGVNTLKSIGIKGNDAGLVTMSTSLAVMLLRPLVIMFDKNTTKEEKVYAASWIFALSAAGLAMQAALYKPFSKLANTLAKDLLKLKDPEAIKGAAESAKYVLFNGAAIVATYLNTRYVGRLMDAISLKLTGKTFTKKPEKEPTKEEITKNKRIDKIIMGSFAALGSFVAINLVGLKLGKGPIATKALKNGFNNTINFLKNNSKTFNKLTDALKSQTDKLAKWANNPNGKFGTTAWYAKQANVGDGWIIRNMIANAIVRPTIALLSGQPYVAFRCFVDEGLGALIVKFAGAPIIKGAKPFFNKALRTTPEVLKHMPVEESNAIKKGVDVITGQLVRNVGILCVALGFMNNYLSSRMVKLLDKFKKPEQKEQEYKDFKQNFIPAGKLSGVEEGMSLSEAHLVWLNKINHK